MIDNIPRCDQCNKPAIQGARDLIEIESDTKWANFRPLGEWRYGCGDHIVRLSRIYYLTDPDYPVKSL